MRAHISVRSDSDRRTADRTDDLETIPGNVKDLIKATQTHRQEALDFLQKSVQEALQVEPENGDEDVRITDIRSTCRQSVERKFRKVLAARSLAREYGAFRSSPNDLVASKSLFCKSVGQKKSHYRPYIIRGEKLLRYEEEATPGVSVIFTFVWSKGMRLKDQDEIPMFADLLRKHERTLYQRLDEQREWLETCQRLYDGMLIDRLFKRHGSLQQDNCRSRNAIQTRRSLTRDTIARVDRSTQETAQASKRCRQSVPSERMTKATRTHWHGFLQGTGVSFRRRSNTKRADDLVNSGQSEQSLRDHQIVGIPQECHGTVEHCHLSESMPRNTGNPDQTTTTDFADEGAAGFIRYAEQTAVQAIYEYTPRLEISTCVSSTLHSAAGQHSDSPPLWPDRWDNTNLFVGS